MSVQVFRLRSVVSLLYIVVSVEIEGSAMYKPPPATTGSSSSSSRPSTTGFVAAAAFCSGLCQLFMMLILKKVYLESQKVLLFFGDGIRGSLSTVH